MSDGGKPPGRELGACRDGPCSVGVPGLPLRLQPRGRWPSLASPTSGGNLEGTWRRSGGRKGRARAWLQRLRTQLWIWGSAVALVTASPHSDRTFLVGGGQGMGYTRDSRGRTRPHGLPQRPLGPFSSRPIHLFSSGASPGDEVRRLQALQLEAQPAGRSPLSRAGRRPPAEVHGALPSRPPRCLCPGPGGASASPLDSSSLVP